jgi:hypothetical protein
MTRTARAWECFFPVVMCVIAVSILSACNQSGRSAERKGVADAVAFLSPTSAVATLKARVVKDGIYPWTTIDRLAFYPSQETDQHIEVQISEIHKGDDGADPNTHPTVNFWRVDRRTGQWEVAWPAPGEGWISYEQFRAKQKSEVTAPEEAVTNSPMQPLEP